MWRRNPWVWVITLIILAVRTPIDAREASLNGHATNGREGNAAVKVQASVFEVGTDGLGVQYVVTNTAGHEVYLFNRLFVTDIKGQRTLDPNRAYAEVRGTTLHLAKQLVEIPPGMLVEFPVVPYLTRLDPGESLEEKMEFELPIREDQPYMTVPFGANEREVTCEELVFTIGYFVAREEGWVREVTVGDETALSTDYGYAIQTHRTASSRPIAVRCRCMVTTST
jgi:hypothetical protein